MKKLGQKASFLTKILLVIGLLISNLSSLSVVFAYEATGDLVISLNDDTLEINYVEELAEEVEAVNVKVYENYTYSDGSSEKEVVTNYSLTAEQLLAASEGKLKLVHGTIFASEEVEYTEEKIVENFKLFDGTYSAKVEIIDVTDYSETVEEEETTITEEEVNEIQTIEDESLLVEEDVNVTETIIAEGIYEEEMTHDSGLNIKLFDSTGSEIVLVDGKYHVSADYSKVRVVAQILSGGLNPNDIFVYNDEEYRASELIELEFSSETEFGGRLYGEYELPVEVKVLKPLSVDETVGPETTVEVMTTDAEVNVGQYEEVVYNNSVRVLYESYELNAELLNSVAEQEAYGETYLFYSDTSDGLLYVLPEFEETSESAVTRTMLDLYNMLNVALHEEDTTVEPIITYTLLKNGINVLAAYDANSGITLEDYLATIALDEAVSVTLCNEGLTVIYEVVMAGDLNADNVVSEEDVLELINQVIGESEITDVNKSDLYGFDNNIDSLDVLYLNQVVKTQVWGSEINESEVKLDATLDVKFNGEVLSEENYLTSGDEFTVDYVLSLIDYEVNGVAGLFGYDETLFELISVEVKNDWLGNEYEGKFLYLGDESLTGPELETVEPEIPENETPVEETAEEIVEEEVVPIEYVVVTATFKALGATSEESNNIITLDEIELYNSNVDGVISYVLDQTSVSTEAINVTVSEDNSLRYLEIAGIEIALKEDVYEYEITVPSDVTTVDLKYILNNVAASVTSEVYPEELVEGSNTVVLTVVSESGVSQEYVINVIREEVEEEETTTQVNYGSSSNNTTNDNGIQEEVVTPEVSDDDVVEEEEESNLSRIIIIILILIVIAGLVYLIFKDDDDAETKKANKEVNKLKKASVEPEVKVTSKETIKAAEKNVSKSGAKTVTKTASNKSGSNNKNKNTRKSSNSKNKER